MAVFTSILEIEDHTAKLKRRHPRLKQLIDRVGALEIDLPKWKNIDDAVLDLPPKKWTL